MNGEKAVAVKDKDSLHPFSMTPRTFEEALKFAELMAKSDLVPKDFKDKPGNILVAIQKGYEVGLSPMAALETIAVINGRASLWGDGLLGIVQGSAVYESIDESQTSEKAGVCTVKRKGEAPYTVIFTLEDARRAGLLGKPGPWTQYTKRMLQMRARSFALRDKFADILKGLIAAEEALDTVTVQATVSHDDVPVLSLKDKLKAQIEAQPVPIAEEEQPAKEHAVPLSDENLKEWFIKEIRDAKTKSMATQRNIEAHKDERLNADQKTQVQDAYYEKWGNR